MAQALSEFVQTLLGKKRQREREYQAWGQGPPIFRLSLLWLSWMAAPALLWPGTCRPQINPPLDSTGSLLTSDPIPPRIGPRPYTYRHHGLWWTQAGQITNANNEGAAGSKVMTPTFQEAITQFEELGSNRTIGSRAMCQGSWWQPPLLSHFLSPSFGLSPLLSWCKPYSICHLDLSHSALVEHSLINLTGRPQA